MIVFWIFVSTIAVTLLASAVAYRYFRRAAIRAAEQAAKDYRPSYGSVCGHDLGCRNLPDVRGGRIEQKTGKLE